MIIENRISIGDSKNPEFLCIKRRRFVEDFKTFGGLRNEEDFLITETGFELLGKPKPKSISDVEQEWAKG